MPTARTLGEAMRPSEPDPYDVGKIGNPARPAASLAIVMDAPALRRLFTPHDATGALAQGTPTPPQGAHYLWPRLTGTQPVRTPQKGTSRVATE
jgi:hypothetical protein